MRKFSVGRSYPKKFKVLAYLIRIIEGGASHEFITWKDELGLRWVAEARGGGARMLSNIEFKEINYVVDVYSYSVEGEKFKEVVTYVWENINKKYGHLQIIGIAIMRFLNLIFKTLGLKRKFTNWFRDGDFSLICCEFSMNAVRIGKNVLMPEKVENYGLRESKKFHEKWGAVASIDKINRINGV